MTFEEWWFGHPDFTGYTPHGVAKAAWEAARADVDGERYRWLRVNANNRAWVWGEPHENQGDKLLEGDALDAAIDSEMRRDNS